MRGAVLLLTFMLSGFLLWSGPAWAQGADDPASGERADGAAAEVRDPRELRPLDLDGDFATSDLEPVGRDLPGGDSMGRSLLTVVIWLLVCTALIYGLVSLLKLLYRRVPGSATNVLIEPLTVVALGPGLALHVVRFHDELLLLGATASSVTLIERVTDPERVAFFLKAFAPGPGAPNQAAFAATLRRVQHRMGLPLTPPPRLDGATIFGPETPQARAEARSWLIADPEPAPSPEADKLADLRSAIQNLSTTPPPAESR